eukprot:6213008-Pleurochrysis_carterae.AAC.3
MPRPPIRDQRSAHRAVEDAAVHQRAIRAVESEVQAGGAAASSACRQKTATKGTQLRRSVRRM